MCVCVYTQPESCKGEEEEKKSCSLTTRRPRGGRGLKIKKELDGRDDVKEVK